MSQINEQIKLAFDSKDIEQSKKLHDQARDHEEEHQKIGSYIKSAIYGGSDGIITTPALIASSVFFASAQQAIDIIALAAIISDGFAMAFGDFLTTRSKNDYTITERARESWEIDNFPDGEKQEMVEIYMQKGMKENDAVIMVDTMSRNKQAFLEIMMREELGIVDSYENPVYHALVTFFSFVILGLLPVLPQLVARIFKASETAEVDSSFAIAAVALFALGAFKTKITKKNWIISGLEALAVGVIVTGTALLISFICGHFIDEKVA
jgi:VIT1/CCC1 family predicted Fe2+/Mn2+ transporter